MDIFEFGAAWFLVAVAGAGIAALPWSEPELRESASAFRALPAALWAWGAAAGGVVWRGPGGWRLLAQA